jgi:hypothetical protein
MDRYEQIDTEIERLVRESLGRGGIDFDVFDLEPVGVFDGTSLREQLVRNVNCDNGRASACKLATDAALPAGKVEHTHPAGRRRRA